MYKAMSGIALLPLVMMFGGCLDSGKDEAQGRPVVNIDDDDPEMNAAIATAKKTLPYFESHWNVLESDGYSLKFAMPAADGELEHIWFTPLSIKGDQFTGQCANDPVRISDLKLGDVRTVTRDSVTDWMIVMGGKCIGGYTIRVLAKREPDAAPPLEFVDPPRD